MAKLKSSSYRWVTAAPGERWKWQVVVNGQIFYGGTYDTEIEAAAQVGKVALLDSHG